MANLIPTPEGKVALEVLKEKLTSFESAPKALQGGGSNRVHRYQSRVMFDHLLDEFEIGGNIPHLRQNARTVNNPHFENGIVKTQSAMEDTLFASEKAAVKVFLRVVPQAGGEATIAEETTFIICMQKHRVCECTKETTK